MQTARKLTYQVGDVYEGTNLRGEFVAGVVVAHYPSQSRMSVEDSRGIRHLVWLS